MTTKYLVVLSMQGDPDADGDEERREVWLPRGEIEVAMGTKRATIIERVLAGQLEPLQDTVGPEVPQLGLEPGDRGELLLIQAADAGERVPVVAVRRFAVEPAGAQTELAV